MTTESDRVRGVLLGAAVGDALGLPAEGLSAARAQRLFPPPWRHRLILGRGMVSDDTDHSVFVTRALIRHGDSPDDYVRALARALKLWLAALPAGVGLATLRAIVKLWLFVPPGRSGVWSAGNGPAMRVAPIGARFAPGDPRLRAFVQRSTQVTHSDPRAFVGALAVATGASWAVRHGAGLPASDVLEALRECGAGDAEWLELVEGIERGLREQTSVRDHAEALGLDVRAGKGVTGYAYHSVPVALFAWLRHLGDYETTLTSVLELGGDTDTVGAICGALAGGTVGEGCIPRPWVDGIRDWPHGVTTLQRLGDELARVADEDSTGRVARHPWWALPPRNVLFLLIVLAHGFRRLFPPY